MNNLAAMVVPLGSVVLAAASSNANTAPPILSWWIFGFAVLLYLATGTVRLYKMLQGKDSSDYVTREALDRIENQQNKRIDDLTESTEERVVALHKRTADREAALDRNLQARENRHIERTEKLRREIKEDNNGVHERINDIVEGVGIIKGILQGSTTT